MKKGLNTKPSQFNGFLDNYRALITGLAFLLISIGAKAQIHQPATLWGKEERRHITTIALQGPTGCGVPTSANITVRENYAQYYDSCNKKFYLYDPALNVWDTLHVGAVSTSLANEWHLDGNVVGALKSIGSIDNYNFKIIANNTQSGLIDISNRSTSFGYGSALSNAGDRNSAFGENALASNTSGTNSVAVGANSLASNTGGISNTGIGYNALNGTTGSYNSAVGSAAGAGMTGSYNSIFGFSSGGGSPGGNNNVFFGAYAGAYSAALSNRLIINTLNQSTVNGDTSNSLVVGAFNANPLLQRFKINGRLTINDGTQANGYILGTDATGNSRWVNPSTISTVTPTWYATMAAGSTFSGSPVIDMDGNTFTWTNSAGNFYAGTIPVVIGDVSVSGNDSNLTVINGIWGKRGLRLSGLPTSVGTKSLRIDGSGNVSIADTLANGIAGSGTLNYIPKITTAPSTLGNSQMYADATGVGIANTAPSALLSIGSTGTSGKMTFHRSSNGATVATLESEASGNGFRLTGGYNNMWFDNSGRVSLQSASFLTPAAGFHLGYAGLASNPAMLMSGAWLRTTASGVAQLLIQESGATAFNGSSSGTGLAVNSASTSGNILDVQVNGSSKFRVGGDNTVQSAWWTLGYGSLTSASGAASLNTSGGTTSTPISIYGTGTASSGTQNFVSLSPTAQQSGTAGYNALNVNVTETSIGSGTRNLINAEVGGASVFKVDYTGVLTAAGAGNFAGTTINNSITANGNVTVAGGANHFGWGSSSKITAATNGNITMSNTAVSDFGLLQLGGTSTSFPAIARNGTGIDIKLADNSAYTGLKALTLESTTSATVGTNLTVTNGNITATSPLTSVTGSGNGNLFTTNMAVNTSASYIGTKFLTSITTAAGAGGTMVAQSSVINQNSSTNLPSGLVGYQLDVNHLGTGTISSIKGVQSGGYVANGGSISNNYGFSTDGLFTPGTGTVGTQYGYYYNQTYITPTTGYAFYSVVNPSGGTLASATNISIMPATASGVGIGVITPDASSKLDITSTTKGLLIPRMTNAQMAAISSPATGLLVFNTDSATIHGYNGTNWQKYLTANSAGNVGIGTTSPTRLLQVGTVDPVISLKQTTSAQEYSMRIGTGSGLSSQSWNLYDNTASKYLISGSGNRVVIGNPTSAYAASTVYIKSYGSGGSNLDVQPDSAVFDEGNIEIMASDYTLGKGIAMRQRGNVGIAGTTMGYANRNMGLLDFNEDYNIIRTNNDSALRFGINNVEKMELNSEGLLLQSKLSITTGSNASVGQATLVGGTATVNTTAVTASSLIYFTVATPGGTQGFLSVGTITAATSFVINSTSGTETSVVNWWIIN